jgi:hypothetical protein
LTDFFILLRKEGLELCHTEQGLQNDAAASSTPFPEQVKRTNGMLEKALGKRASAVEQRLWCAHEYAGFHDTDTVSCIAGGVWG